MTSRPSFSRHFSWCVLVFPTVFPPCWEGPPVLLELVLLIHLVQKAQHSSHPRIKKLKKQQPFVPPARPRLVIYFFFKWYGQIRVGLAHWGIPLWENKGWSGVFQWKAYTAATYRPQPECICQETPSFGWEDIFHSVFLSVLSWLSWNYP